MVNQSLKPIFVGKFLKISEIYAFRRYSTANFPRHSHTIPGLVMRPKRKDILTREEKKTCPGQCTPVFSKGAASFFLAPEFAEELKNTAVFICTDTGRRKIFLRKYRQVSCPLCGSCSHYVDDQQ
jgi:hypothetical protein